MSEWTDVQNMRFRAPQIIEAWGGAGNAPELTSSGGGHGLDIPPRSWIVCDNGHRICFAREGLAVGQHINSWAERLSRWHQPEPQVGSHPDYTCDVCGASWGPSFKYEADR